MAHTIAVGTRPGNVEQKAATTARFLRAALLVALGGGLLLGMAQALVRAPADMNWTGDPSVLVLSQFGD